MKVEDSQQIAATVLKGKKTEKQQDKPVDSSPQNEAMGTSSEPARIEISQQSREAQKAAEISRQTPEIREDKVQALKAKIERGEYSVDSRDVADKIMRDLLSELIG
jgi:negative regulator of flagellin synthesis FlgM